MKHQNAMSSQLEPLEVHELDRVAGGQIGPDQSLDDFPVWAWPYINVARELSVQDMKLPVLSGK
jgi:hypothetical protein